ATARPARGRSSRDVHGPMLDHLGAADTWPRCVRAVPGRIHSAGGGPPLRTTLDHAERRSVPSGRTLAADVWRVRRRLGRGSRLSRRLLLWWRRAPGRGHAARVAHRTTTTPRVSGPVKSPS